MKRYLLLTPIIVLFITLFFLNRSLQYMKSVSYSFVYNTNVGSVQQFYRELDELSAQGFTGDVYTNLYNHMIRNYSKTLGEKKAIITFLMDNKGNLYHSSDYNESYLSDSLQDEKNMKLINDAYASRSNGEITLEHNGSENVMYYQQYFSESHEYTLFMGVDKQVVEADLHIYEIIIPISIIGLLLFITMEYTIWLKLVNANRTDEK